MSACPCATNGRAGRQADVFLSSTLFVLNALSISALTCFLFFSHPNTPTSASFAAPLTGSFLHHPLERRSQGKRADRFLPSQNRLTLHCRRVVQGGLTLLPLHRVSVDAPETTGAPIAEVGWVPLCGSGYYQDTRAHAAASWPLAASPRQHKKAPSGCFAKPSPAEESKTSSEETRPACHNTQLKQAPGHGLELHSKSTQELSRAPRSSAERPCPLVFNARHFGPV